MSRHERGGFLKSMVAGSVKWILNFGGLLGLSILGLLMIIGLGVAFVYFKLGILEVYAVATALVVLMGWVVYNTDRRDRDKLIEKMNSVGAYIDTVDAVLIFGTWAVFIAVTIDFPEELTQSLDNAAIPLAFIMPMLRRWLFPSTVVPFQSKNAFLRTTSILCIVHSVITLMFGVSANAIDSPAHYAGIFYLIAGALLLLAAWCHRIESRQDAMKSSLSTGERCPEDAGRQGVTDMQDQAHGILGHWQAVSATLEGEGMPDQLVEATTLEISEGHYVVDLAGNIDEGECVIHWETEPIQMTIRGTKGPNAGKTYLAIVELLEDDKIRIAYDLSGTEYPNTFEPNSKKSNYVAAFERRETRR